MSDDEQKSWPGDYQTEVVALRKRGYSAEEIRALLSDDKWLGNVRGDRREADLHVSGLPEDE